MIKKLLLVAGLFLYASSLEARARYLNYVTDGATPVVASYWTSTKALRACPSSSVSVYLAGTSTLATIYSTEAGAPKSSTFTTPSSGLIDFWADDGEYKIVTSSGGCTTRTWDNVQIGTPGQDAQLSLASFATGGAGTALSPYTGWETGFTTLATAGTGTISVTTATSPTTVTGTSTLFLTELAVGTYLKVGSNFGRVSAIASNTSATVETWVGATQSGQAYTIWNPKTMNVCGHFSTASTIVAAYPGLRLRGCGSGSTYITFTVAGIGLDIRIPDANGYITDGVNIDGMTFVGSSATTPALVSVQNVTRFQWDDVRLTKSGGSYGLFIDNAVIADISHFRYSENEIAQSVEPSVAAVACTPCYAVSWTSINIEGMQAATGFQLTGSYNTFHGGTIEGNLINFEILDIGNSTGSINNSLYGTDLERASNTTYSARITGSDYLLFSNVNCNDDVEIFQSGTQTPRANKIVGGQYSTITIGASVQHTTIQDIRYTGSISDSGTATRRAGNITGSPALPDWPFDTTGRIQVHQQATLATTVTASTGLDTGSAAVENNCCDSSMIIALSPNGTPASTGTVTVTFAQAWPPSRRPAIVASLLEYGAPTWNAAASPLRVSQVTQDGSSNTTSFVITWNNSVALSAGTVYRISVVVIGRK